MCKPLPLSPTYRATVRAALRRKSVVDMPRNRSALTLHAEHSQHVTAVEGEAFASVARKFQRPHFSALANDC